MAETGAKGIFPVAGRVFEDTIDGYFPLQVSLAQMLERRGFVSAWVSLIHAPIIEVPGLAPDAPVPLSIRAGRAGIVARLVAEVTMDGLRGHGRWRWLDGSAPRPVLDPMTRLAEPVFLQGFGIAGERSGAHGLDQAAILRFDRLTSAALANALDRLDWPAVRIWGPLPDAEGIHPEPAQAPVQGRLFGAGGRHAQMPELHAPGAVLLLRAEPPAG